MTQDLESRMVAAVVNAKAVANLVKMLRTDLISGMAVQAYVTTHLGEDYWNWLADDMENNSLPDASSGSTMATILDVDTIFVGLGIEPEDGDEDELYDLLEAMLHAN